MIEGLKVPERLIALAETGIWPRTYAECLAQVSQPRVPEARVRLISPDDTQIYLYLYPHFGSVQRSDVDIWLTHGDPEDLVLPSTLIIGDFGAGSDSSIVLDYRTNAERPAVLRLAWEFSRIEDSATGEFERRVSARWVMCAPTFDDFVDLCGLESAAPLRPLE